MSSSVPASQSPAFTSLTEFGFKHLSDNVQIFDPPENNASSTASPVSHPRTVLICAWMNAPDRPLIRYCSVYRSMYPRARIVLTGSSAMGLMDDGKLRSKLQPALNALLNPPGNPILAHVFSNGGSFIFCQLGVLHGAPVPGVKAIVFDSAPGQIHLSNFTNVFVREISNNVVVQTVASAAIVISVVGAAVLHALTGYGLAKGADPVSQAWKLLLEPNVVSRNPKRLFIYSTEDNIIYASDIEEHIEHLKGFGAECRTEKFKDSKHVGHVLVDPGRYWRAVRDLWDWASSGEVRAKI